LHFVSNVAASPPVRPPAMLPGARLGGAWVVLALIACLSLSAARAHAAPVGFENSVQVDPGFPYYAGRSPQSIAEELKVNGYQGVRYIIVRESTANAAFVAACRASGLPVSFTTLGNGVYSTGDLPPGWQHWRMRMAHGGEPHEGYTYLCMNHPEYRRWKKAQAVATLGRIPFDGFEIMESFWPGYQGPAGARYGCVCSFCRAAFLRAHPAANDLPDFTDPAEPAYYRKKPALYQQWVEFRAASVAEFLDDLVNGTNGVRASFPGLAVAVWGIADAVPDGVAKLKEWEGLDGALVVRTVRPDWYVIQTDWPDWTRPNLPPDYVLQYRPFVADIRATGSKIPLQVQTDIGSNEHCRRGSNWLSQCEVAARGIGIAGVVAYEYHLSRDLYDAPPRPMRALGATNTITLIFNKRLNPANATAITNYTAASDRLLSARVDGNLVQLEVTGHPTRVTARNLADDPSRRFFKHYPAMTMPSPVTLPVEWR
jgi:hypothetical protein